MASISDVFRDIHRLRRLARDLQTEIDRAPYQLKAHRAKAAKLEETFKTAQDTLKHLKVTIRDREATLKSTHQQIEKYKRQFDEAKDKKQYEALQHEITGVEGKAAALEEEILNGIAESEERAAQLPEQEKAVARGKDELAAFEKDQQARLARLAAELQQSLAQLKETEGQLPDDVKPLYARLVTGFGADALAAVKDRTCQHCHTAITIQQQHEIESGRYVTCRSCGRGLYLPA
jgi:predicted  nucleic acid-binding Zn-ribbon protein